MKPIEFEFLVKRHFEETLKQSNQNVEVKHGERLTSLAGNRHQIDLHYTFNVGGFDYLTLIECKCLSRNVSKKEVTALKGVMDDLKAHKGILVANVGFQKGAIEFARSNNIGLFRLTGNKAETLASFDGGLKRISEFLVKEPEDTYGSYFVGMFHVPESSVIDYFVSKYGVKLCLLVLEMWTDKTQQMKLDDPSYSPPDEIINSLKSVPNNWYKEYILIHSAGTGLKLSSENDIRLIDLVVSLLKFKSGLGIGFPGIG